MSEGKYFEDVSPEEEANLPLPGDWMRTIQSRQDGVKVRVYKNLKTGQEIDEHPIIARAMNVARKLPLPLGWCMMETKSEQGHVERFYYNADLQLSLWDPPMLRSCLADYLRVLGFDPDTVGFRTEVSPPGYGGIEERKSPLQTSNENGGSGYGGTANSLLNRGNQENKLSLMDLDQLNQDSPQPPTSPYPYRETETERVSDALVPIAAGTNNANNKSLSQSSSQIQVPSSSQLQHVPPPRDWEGLLNIFREPILPFSEKVSHRADGLQPPMTWAGVKILRGDVKEANERIHHLISRIRSMLATLRGYTCSFLYHDSEQHEADDDASESSQSNMKTVVTLASDIVTTLRQQPELVVMAIATNNMTIGSTAMLQAAFVALHRLLHPFSTDYSMTTALLLQSINHQLEELATVEQIFCHMDSKMIIPRALSIYDPVMAVQWNPVENPLPMIPNVQSETVFACLMRVYAIRRDVTAFFRAVWKPVLPAIATLLESKEAASNPVVLENLISLSYRLLENTFHEKSMTVFPITATAVCRAVYEIGGQAAMVTLIYNYLILPNLVKILGGDHDSLENEDIYRVENASKVINRYFDYTWWLQSNDSNVKQYKSDQDRPLVILKSYLWTVWRLFSCSMYLTDTEISAITVPEFIQTRLSFLNCTGIKDHKLRNLLARVNRKVSHGCNWLIQMPLDVHGNSFLGVEHQDLDLDGVLTMNHETHELLDRRLSSLAFKPGEMLNATVVSKYELCGFLSDVGCAMDDRDFPTDSPIYRGIADFLSVYGNNARNGNVIMEEANEELITLTFLYTHHDDEYEDEAQVDQSDADNERTMIQPHHHHQAIQNQEQMMQEYRQLLSGLKLLNRYEDTLLNLIRKIDEGVVSNIYELLSDATNAWYLEPEFDTEFKVNHIEIAEKHTHESRNKVKHSYHGVKQSQPVKIVPLFSQHNSIDHHPNNKSLKELQKEFFQSFRFGSAQQNVGVGTSLARQKVLPPKVERGQIKVTTLPSNNHHSSQYPASEASSRNTQNYRSHFTEPTIKPTSSILAPTKSLINMKNASPVTPMELDKNFMKSMRSHEVISTEDFQMRYFRRRNQAVKSLRNGGAGSRLSGAGGDGSKRRGKDASGRERKLDSVAASAAKPPPAPKPFPAHLRYLIRHDEGDEQSENYGAMNDNAYNFHDPQEELYDHGDGYGYGYGYENGYPDMDGTEWDGMSPAPSSGQYFSQSHHDNNQEPSEEYEPQYYRDGEYAADHSDQDPNYFHSLIHDYQATIQPVANMYHNDDFGTTAALLSSQLSARNSEQGRGSRARSPALPVPLDNSRIWSPTKSYVEKHRPPINSDAFMRDISEGRPPELRQYHHEVPTVVHDEPFSPTKSKVYQSTGARAPRLPEFLAHNHGGDDSMYATSVSNSRDSTPISRRGRTRSRSSSPAATTRSRSGSYAKPTFASIQQLSDRSYSLRGETRPDYYEPPVKPPTSNSPRSSLSSSPTRADGSKRSQRLRDQRQPEAAEQEKLEESQEQAIPANEFLHHYGQPPMQTAELESELVDPPLLSASRGILDHVNLNGTSTALVKDAAPIDKREEQEAVTTAPNTELTGVRVIKKKIKLSRQKINNAQPSMESRPLPLTPPSKNRKLVDSVLPIQLQPGISHKQTFAEAIASVVSEAAASTANGPPDSTYSLSFSPDVDHERTTTNLQEDRLRALERRLELLQRHDSDSIIVDEDNKYLEFKTGPGTSSRRAKSERFKGSDMNLDSDKVDSTDAGNGRIPLMKRKSLIKNFNDNKEMFVTGFFAKKHGRSGQPKMKKIQFDEEKKNIIWSEEKRSSITSLFGAKDKEPSSLSIFDVVDVKRGIHTEVLLKAGLLDPNLCLSLIAKDRTLDLVFTSVSDRDGAFRGLQAIALSCGTFINFV